MKKNYNLKLTVESCQDLKKRIKGLKDDLKKINKPYIEECLEWIKKRSIDILNEKAQYDTYKLDLSRIRADIAIVDLIANRKYELLYYADDVSYAEFGTGVVGQSSPHPKSNEVGYHYASGEYSGTGDGSWDWYNEKYGIGIKGFKGYKGKRFIYEAFQDFINEDQYIKIYQRLQRDILNKYF